MFKKIISFIKVKKEKKVTPFIILSHSINFNMSTYEFVENDKKYIFEKYISK